MEQGILYIEYDYFMLEGIPPMGGNFTPMDQRDLQWVDMRDARRYHTERYFRTQETPPREGLASYATGTGAGGIDKQCGYVEDKMTCQQQPITDTLTYDDWLGRLTRLTRQRVEIRNDAAALKALNNSVFKGTQQDPDWGEVYVFERRLPIAMSDRYQGQEGIETQLIDAKTLRRIEERRVVMDGSTEVLHMQYRLTKWEVLDPATVPPNLFDPDYVPDGTFVP